MKVDRFTKTVVLLNCIVPVTLLGWDAWGGQLGANPVNFAIRTTGMLVAHLPRAVAGRHAREPDHRLGLARPVSADARALRLLPRRSALSSSSSGSTGRRASATPLSEILMRPYLMVGTVGLVAHGAAGGDLDERHDQAAGAAAVEGSAPAGLRRGGGRGPALLHARQGRRHAADRVRRRPGRALPLPPGRPLLAAPDRRPQVSGPLPPAAAPPRGRSPGPGN